MVGVLDVLTSLLTWSPVDREESRPAFSAPGGGARWYATKSADGALFTAATSSGEEEEGQREDGRPLLHPR